MSEMLRMEISDSTMQLLANFPKLPWKVENSIHKEMNRMALDIRNNILEKMQKSPKNTSKSYKRGGKIHHPSYPGNPPRPDSSRLWNSFEILTSSSQIEVGTNVVYAKFLQEGTKRMDARPFLESGLEGIEVDERLRDAIARGFEL